VDVVKLVAFTTCGVWLCENQLRDLGREKMKVFICILLVCVLSILWVFPPC